MRLRRWSVAAAAGAGLVKPALSDLQADRFGALSGLVGKTWRSAPAQAGETGPADLSRRSWDLGGRILVNRHALEDGSYGGVTDVYENAQTGALDYVHVASAGFHTSGSCELGDDASWTAEEAVTGHDTITRVRSTGRNAVYVPVKAKVPEITGRPAE